MSAQVPDHPGELSKVRSLREAGNWAKDPANDSPVTTQVVSMLMFRAPAPASSGRKTPCGQEAWPGRWLRERALDNQSVIGQFPHHSPPLLA